MIKVNCRYLLRYIKVHLNVIVSLRVVKNESCSRESEFWYEMHQWLSLSGVTRLLQTFIQLVLQNLIVSFYVRHEPVARGFLLICVSKISGAMMW